MSAYHPCGCKIVANLLSTLPGHNGPETSSMGSIADRMLALSGKGMDVSNSTKRNSKEMTSSPVIPHKSAALGAMSIAGGWDIWAGENGRAGAAAEGSIVYRRPTSHDTA